MSGWRAPAAWLVACFVAAVTPAAQIIMRGQPLPAQAGQHYTLAQVDETLMQSGVAGATIDTSNWPVGPALLAFGEKNLDVYEWQDVWVNDLAITGRVTGRKVTLTWPTGTGPVYGWITNDMGQQVWAGWITSNSFTYTAPEPDGYRFYLAPSGHQYSLYEARLVDYANDRRVRPYFPTSATSKTTVGFSWDKTPEDDAFLLQVYAQDGTPAYSAYFYDSVGTASLPQGSYKWRVWPFSNSSGSWVSAAPSDWVSFDVVPPKSRLEDLLGATPVSDGTPRSANLSYPEDVVSLGGGRYLVSDTYHSVLKVIDGTTTKVVVGTGMGGYNGDGYGTDVMLNQPTGLALAPDGDVYLADTGNYLLRKVNTKTWQVTTLAGNPGQAGGRNADGTLATSGLGWMKLVRMHDGTPFVGMSFPGDNVPPAVYSWSPERGFRPVPGTTSKPSSRILGFDWDDLGYMRLFYADYTGVGHVAKIFRGFAFDVVPTLPNPAVDIICAGGETFYFGARGALGYWDGQNVSWLPQSFANVSSLRRGENGSLLAVDSDHPAVYEIDPATFAATELASNMDAVFSSPVDIANVGPDLVYVLCNNPPAVFSYRPSDGATRRLAGNGQIGFARPGPALLSPLSYPTAMAVDPQGNILITEGHGVIRVSAQTGRLSRYLGNSQIQGKVDSTDRLSARFSSPRGVSADAFGRVWIADTYNNVVRMYSRITGGVTTAVGTGDRLSDPPFGLTALQTGLNHPLAAVWASDRLYVANSWSNTIGFVGSDGKFVQYAGAYNPQPYQGYGSTLDGPRLSASFNTPGKIVPIADGTMVVAETFGNRICLVTDYVTGIAGDGRHGYTDISLNSPTASLPVQINGQSVLLICDTANGLLRSLPMPVSRK